MGAWIFVMVCEVGVEGGRLKKLKVGTLIGVMDYDGEVGGGRVES
jgi:hypothetical protein